MSDSLTNPMTSASAVPLGYAEKAMGSLMQLHTELMQEKEKRVDLYRQLMEKEQALAELRMYVKMLEQEKQHQQPAPVPPAVPAPAVTIAAEPTVIRAQHLPRTDPTERRVPHFTSVTSAATPAKSFERLDGWKTW